MNLFELVMVLSPMGGGVGGAMAVVHRGGVSTPFWMWGAVPLGLACGLGCFVGLIYLAVGRRDGRRVELPGWRMALLLGVTLFAPMISGALSYRLIGLLFDALT